MNDAQLIWQPVRAILGIAILPARTVLEVVHMHPYILAEMDKAIQRYPQEEDEIITFVAKRRSDPENYPDAGETAFAIRRKYPLIKPRKRPPIPSVRRERR